MLLSPIRAALTDGELLLDVRAAEIAARSQVIVDHLVATGRLDADHRQAVLTALALRDFEARQRPLTAPELAALPPEVDPRRVTGKLFGGLRADLQRRLPHYRSDLRDGLQPEALGSVLFLLFAALAPAITLGGIMADQTGGTEEPPEEEEDDEHWLRSRRTCS